MSHGSRVNRPPLPLPPSAKRSRVKPVLGALGYIRKSRERCFICALVSGEPGYTHHVVYEDDGAIAFLVRSPTVWGHVLVAPKQHREEVLDDFDEASYLALQRVLRSVGAGVSRAVPCERLYLMSLGSRQMNRHVHWHVVPLAPGVPILKQQLRVVSELIHGVISCPDSEFERLARHIREELVEPSPRRLSDPQRVAGGRMGGPGSK